MSKNILIIEDDSFIQELTAKKLEKAGFVVHLAQNGQEAFKKVEDVKFDLIVCDLVIPRIDGFEVIKKLRTMNDVKDVPIVVFSNLADADAFSKATEAGATKFLVKANFSLADVVQEIESLIGKA